MRKIIITFILCFVAANTFAQVKTIDDIIGVWTEIASLNEPLLDDEIKPQKIKVEGIVYKGWVGSIIIEKRPRYAIYNAAGYDDILKTYYKGDKLFLEVENKDGKSKGTISITFINKDVVYFTLISGELWTWLSYGKDNLYLRAPVLE